MATDRKIKVELEPDPNSSEVLPGAEITVKVSLTEKNRKGKFVSLSRTTSSKELEGECVSFDPPRFSLKFRRSGEKRVKLKSVEAGYDFEPTLTLGLADPSNKPGKPPSYNYDWTDGYAKDGKIKIKKPAAWLKRDPEDGSLSAGGTIKLAVGVEAKASSAIELKITGDGVIDEQTLEIPNGEESLEQELDVTGGVASGKTIEVAFTKLGGAFEGPDPLADIEIKEWKLSFDGDPAIKDSGGRTDIFRNDTLELNVKLPQAAESEEEFTIQLIDADGAARARREGGDAPPPVMEFDELPSISKGEDSAKVELFLDATKFPKTITKSESVTLHLVSAEGRCKGIEPGEGAEKQLEIAPFELEFDPPGLKAITEVTPDHGEHEGKPVLIDGDKVKIKLKGPAKPPKPFLFGVRFLLEEKKGFYIGEGWAEWGVDKAEQVIEVDVKGKAPLEKDYPVSPVVRFTREKAKIGKSGKPEPDDSPSALAPSEPFAFFDVEANKIEGEVIRALPAVTFAEKPVPDRSLYNHEKKGQQDYFRLAHDQWHPIVIKRSYAAPGIETKVRLEGKEIVGVDPDPIVFPAATKYSEEADIEVEAKIKLKSGDRNKPGSILLKLGGAEGTPAGGLVPKHGSKTPTTLKIRRSQPHLSFGDEWLFPGLLPVAPGDQAWIRLEATGLDLKQDGKVVERNCVGTISCEAFEKNSAQSDKREYPVVFESAKAEVSLDVRAPYKDIHPNKLHFDDAGGWPDPDVSKGESGIRVRVPGSADPEFKVGSYPVSFKSLENDRGKPIFAFKGAEPLLEVRPRYAFIANPPDLNGVKVGDTVEVTIGLSHPARTNTAVVVSGNGCSRNYYAGFWLGQDAVSFEVEVDKAPPPAEPLRLEVKEYSGNISLADGEEEAESFPPSIERAPTFVGVSREQPFKEAVFESGKPALPTFGKGSKSSLVVRLSQAAMVDCKVEVIAPLVFPLVDESDPSKGAEVLEVQFSAGEAEKEVEVTFAQSSANGADLLIRPKWSEGLLTQSPPPKELIEEGVPELESAVRVIVRDPPKCVFGKWVEPMGPVPDGQQTVPKILDEQSWIEPGGGETEPSKGETRGRKLPPNFVAGEKAEVFVSLEEAVAEEVKGFVVSPVIKTGKAEFTIPAQKLTPDKKVKVTFAEENLGILKEYFGVKRKKTYWGNHPIVIRPVNPEAPTITPGSEDKSVWVFDKRRVLFDQSNPVVPDGPFVQDDKATVHIRLDHPAPSQGATAKVEGPFAESPVEIKIEHGHSTGSAPITFNADCTDPDKLEIKAGEGCEIDGGDKATVRVATPEVEFDSEEWGEDSKLVLGTTVRLPFLMKGQCPQEVSPEVDGQPAIRGAVMAAECELFEPWSADIPGSATERVYVESKPNAHPVQFVEEQNEGEENRAWIEVRVRSEKPAGQESEDEGEVDLGLIAENLKLCWGVGGISVDGEMKLRSRCKIADGAEASKIGWQVAPTVQFKEQGLLTYAENETGEILVMNPDLSKIEAASPPQGTVVMDFVKPAEGVCFEEGDSVTLSLEPTMKVPEDLSVRVRSKAMGSKSHLVKIPKNSDAAVDVELTWTSGRPAVSSKLPGEQESLSFVVPHLIELEVVNPSGYETNAAHGEASVAVWNGEGCRPTDEVLLIQNVPPAGVQAETFPAEPCNIPRMLLTVRHGEKIQGASGPETPGGDIKLPERGPYKDGTFEIVADVEAATHKSDALVCTGSRVPVIQVLGSHTSPDPHFGGKQAESIHFTEILVGFEREDEDKGTVKRCRNTSYAIAGGVYSHPFVFVADRRVDPDHLGRRSEGGSLVETPGSVAMPADLSDPQNPPGESLVRREGEAAGEWAPLYPLDDPEYADLTRVLALPVYRGHRNSDQKVEIDEGTGKKKRKKRSAMGTWLRDVRQALSSRESNPNPQQYLIEARSCGMPDPSRDGVERPSRKLRAIVEVYPSDEYCLFIGSQASSSVLGHLEEGKFIKGDKAFDPKKGFEPLDNWLRPAEEIEAVDRRIFESGDPTNDPTDGFKEKYQKDSQYIQNPPPGLQKEWVDAGEIKATDADPPKVAGKAAPSAAPVVDQGNNEPAVKLDPMYKFFSKFEPAKLDGSFTLTPPTRVLYPYGGPDSRVSVTWTPDPDNAGGTLEHSPSTTTSDKTLDAVYGSGVMSLVSDVNIHIGRNGSGIDPESNNEIRNSLKAIIDAFLVLIDALNKSGSSGVAWGFGFSFKVSFLQGHYVRYWGWKEADDQRVFWWNANSIDMKLIGVTMELLFGVAYSMVVYKFEVVIFGQLELQADVKRDFEKVAPTDSTGNWVEKHLDFVTTAKIGVRIVIGRPEYLSFEGAVKVGYTLRFRSDSESQAEIEVYFNGLSVYVEVHILGLFHPKAEKTLIKGNVEGWPSAMITLGHKRERKMLYTDREINKGMSRLRFIRETYLAHLQKYQELQVAIVTAKKVPSNQTYPLTCALPGYRYSETEHLTQEDWDKNKELWDRQWTEVKRSFRFETQMVSRRRSATRKKQLAERLKRKEKVIDDLFKNVFIPKLERLDKLEERFRRVQEAIARDKAKYGEGGIPEKRQSSFWHAAESLTLNDDLNYRKISGDTRWSNQIKELEMQMEGLKYYALKRRKW